MPFTLAHPAAVLLLRRTPLPVAAMVAGAMSPDVPVFLNAYGGPYDFTHSLPGILTIDLAVGAIGISLWFGLLRDPVVDVLPAVLRERLAPRVRYTRRQWQRVAPAVVLGSLTHVVWDRFTHHDRWGVRQIAWLHEQHGPLVGYKWAQYGSSVLGLTVCAVWAFRELAVLPRAPRAVLVPVLGLRALIVVGLLSFSTGLAAGLRATGLGLLVSQTAVVGTMILGLSVLVLAGLWQVLAARRVPATRS